MSLSLSKLGFGVSGAHGTPLVARQATLDLITAAYAGGVSVFDTAPAYGNGEAERRLGAAVREIGRAALVISTKVGLSSSGLARRTRDFSPDAVEASVRASLERLGVEGVDLLFLHGAGAEELTPALLNRLDALARAGAFAVLGAAGRGAELDAPIAAARFGAIMAPVHPFLGPAETARLARARDAGKCVFAIETAGDAPPALRTPRRKSDLYAMTRAIRARAAGRAGRGRTTVPDGLAFAVHTARAECSLFTTTRRDHLDACIATAGQDGRGAAGPRGRMDAG